MPRKIRELKAQIAHEGFVYLPKRGKGSHERWRHPLLKKHQQSQARMEMMFQSTSKNN